MAKIDKKIIKAFDKTRIGKRYLCNAPFVSVKISIDGRVSPCCYNKDMDDIYPKRSLSEIWSGDVFEQYRKNIKKNILPSGCRTCENALLNSEYNSVKIRQYDCFNITKNRLRVIELAMDNTCNLQCVMCNGRHSSSIRQNLEMLPLIPSVFDSGFREELKLFIPHLEQFVFAGGEPFLIKEYYEIWEDIISLNPDCEISLVTNGTVLNNKVRNILERGNFRINLSFDAVTKEVYEKIRVNAEFENVYENIKYFGQYMRNRNSRLHIPVCPLKVNRFQLPDVVRFCNENNYTLNFVHVNGAYNSALWSLGSNELSDLKDFFEQQSFLIMNEVDKNNVAEFKDLIVRLDKWIANAEIKENFKNVFDLDNNEVEGLKLKFFESISRELEIYTGQVTRDNYTIENFITRFELLMDSLPEYFYCNHFYHRLEELSPSIIIEGMLNHTLEIMVEKSMELFFYGQNH